MKRQSSGHGRGGIRVSELEARFWVSGVGLGCTGQRKVICTLKGNRKTVVLLKGKGPSDFYLQLPRERLLLTICGTIAPLISAGHLVLWELLMNWVIELLTCVTKTKQ